MKLKTILILKEAFFPGMLRNHQSSCFNLLQPLCFARVINAKMGAASFGLYFDLCMLAKGLSVTTDNYYVLRLNSFSSIIKVNC